MRLILFFLTLLLINPLSRAGTAMESPLHVVTSFSILEDLVNELGGDRVRITNLVGRNRDAHMYQPKPSDAIAIAKADLVIMNGLGFEGWITRLMDDNHYKKPRLVASEGVNILSHGNEIDPHAWQSLANIPIYSANITEALIDLRPQYQAEFTQRNMVFTQKIRALHEEANQQVAAIAEKNRVIVTSHDAFAYLGREFDLHFIAPVGLSTDSEATANDVAAIVRHIRQNNVKALFIENINNPRLLQQISVDTGVAIGGRLYSDALGDKGSPAGTYLGMMRHNINALVTALTTPQQKAGDKHE